MEKTIKVLERLLNESSFILSDPLSHNTNEEHKKYSKEVKHLRKAIKVLKSVKKEETVGYYCGSVKIADYDELSKALCREPINVFVNAFEPEKPKEGIKPYVFRKSETGNLFEICKVYKDNKIGSVVCKACKNCLDYSDNWIECTKIKEAIGEKPIKEKP